MNYPYRKRPEKSVGIAYLLWIPSLFLIAGLQHFYLAQYIRGIIWLLTGGLVGLGTLWDLFTLNRQTEKANNTF